MNNTTLSDAALLDVVLDRQADTPLFEQLVRALREIILTGRMAPGSKLPSSRKFANELSVSRVTIVTAYDQLTAEGYIESRHGAGVFVVEGLPDDISQVSRELPTRAELPPPASPLLPFQPNSPDMRIFPHRQWAKLYQRIWTNPDANLLCDGDPLGWWPLRQQISEHLRVWRGISCQADQIIITSGAGEAIAAIAESLITSSDHVAIENPGYHLFARTLQKAQVPVQSVNVDDFGMSIDGLNSLKSQPRFAITTPSRQYPLGMTMPLSRRLQLLSWAGNGDRLIIEDDYDSEFRYVGQPLPALMSLANEQSVIYLGSFSKVFSKSLRLGYLVVPKRVLPSLKATFEQNGASASGFTQPVLAKFMESGAFASHLRKMRRIYAERQKTFLYEAQRHLSNLIEFEAAGGGMHLVGKLNHKLAARMSDVEICQMAHKHGIVIYPLSKSFHGANKMQGVIAGYAGFNNDELSGAVVKLAKILQA